MSTLQTIVFRRSLPLFCADKYCIGWYCFLIEILKIISTVHPDTSKETSIRVVIFEYSSGFEYYSSNRLQESEYEYHRIFGNQDSNSMNTGKRYSNINEYRHPIFEYQWIWIFFLFFVKKWKKCTKNFRACCAQPNKNIALVLSYYSSNNII